MKNDTFRAIRLYHDKTQDEMAKVLNVSRSHVGAIEAGLRDVTDKLRIKVLRLFEVTPDKMEEIKRIYKLKD